MGQISGQLFLDTNATDDKASCRVGCQSISGLLDGIKW